MSNNNESPDLRKQNELSDGSSLDSIGQENQEAQEAIHTIVNLLDKGDYFDAKEAYFKASKIVRNENSRLIAEACERYLVSRLSLGQPAFDMGKDAEKEFGYQWFGFSEEIEKLSPFDKLRNAIIGGFVNLINFEFEKDSDNYYPGNREITSFKKSLSNLLYLIGEEGVFSDPKFEAAVQRLIISGLKRGDVSMCNELLREFNLPTKIFNAQEVVSAANDGYISETAKGHSTADFFNQSRIKFFFPDKETKLSVDSSKQISILLSECGNDSPRFIQAISDRYLEYLKSGEAQRASNLVLDYGLKVDLSSPEVMAAAKRGFEYLKSIGANSYGIMEFAKKFNLEIK